VYLIRPPIERDPNVTKMRLDVFEAMQNIAKESFEEQPRPNCHEIKFVSLEDAVRELIDMKKGEFV
jgi:hypothetical protein